MIGAGVCKKAIQRHRAGIPAFGLLIMLLFSFPATSNAAEPWGPWSTSRDAPALSMPADRAASRVKIEPPVPSVAATPFLWLLSFYQKLLGPAVSGRCPMYPTCSQFSVESIHKHGPFIGIVMTADRFIHELDEQEYAPLIKVGDRWRYLDTVQNNDFWWYRE